MIIATESFPGWESFSALVHHLRFVHDHRPQPAGGSDTGLCQWCDIYLIKPLVSDTLLAAVASMARRLQHAAALNGLCLLESELCMRGEASSVSLQAVKASLLVALIRAPGQRPETWQIVEILR